MTSFGILMPAIRPPHTVKYGDDRTLQVRARRAKDLDILRARYMQGTLGPSLHTPDKDYEYRAYCTPHAFAVAMMQMVLEIDYLKFKPTTLDRYEDDELHSAYNKIWSVVMGSLSTKTHQREYFHGTYTGGGGTVLGPKSSTKHTSATSTTDVGRARTGTGWTYPGNDQRRAIGPGTRDWDPDFDMDRVLGLPAGTGHRNTKADRDEYEPEVTDLDQVEEEAELLRAENEYVESLYREIDGVLKEKRSSIDHAECDHPKSDNARARCRRKRRKEASKRIAEIRELIDASHDDVRSSSTVVLSRS